MRSSLRNKLLLTFLVLVVIVGAGTLFAIERTLADDLVEALDDRMSKQGRAIASALDSGSRPEQLVELAAVTGARITVIGADGNILGDSLEPSTVGQHAGSRPVDPTQYLVAVPASGGRIVRLATPAGDIRETRARMRNRLLIGAAAAFVGCLFLSWIFVRAVTRPLQSLTRTARRLAAADYDAPAPQRAIDSGGEIGAVASALMKMANEVKTQIADVTKQRDLLEVVFGSLVEGVVVVGADGKVILINDAARPLLDASRASTSLIESDRVPTKLRPLVDRALAGGEPDEELELASRNVRCSARPLGTAAASGGTAASGGNNTGAIVVLYDVTQLRALESVRREFLSNAAHELRTPITSISGYAETLIGGNVDAGTSKEFLQTIHRNAQRISSMVNDLVLLDTLGGRADAVGARVPIALDQVILDAARTTRGVTPTAKIEVEVPTLSVLGTRDGLDHVFQNLIDNAVKYGNDTQVSVAAETLGRRVRVAVADAGKGIPTGQEERIFERFYRIDPGRSRDKGGSGLGLAIVKVQVEALGGQVWVEDAKPGARFVVELDLA